MGQFIAGQNSVMKTIAFASLLSLVCGAEIQYEMTFEGLGEYDIPDLRDCRPWDLCSYGEGDCGESGDEGCDSGLVCGVNNCGDFVGGMTGSCCSTGFYYLQSRRETWRIWISVDVLVSHLAGRLGQTETETAYCQRWHSV